MHNVYKYLDPTVIEDNLLTQLIHEQGPKGQAGVIAKTEGLSFEETNELAFHYKNIIDIANLWLFSNLTKLQLDNNWIYKIQGLDHLVNLKWLDLSFNYIKRIENLEKLVNLEDLSLFSNQINLLENLESLTKLQFLSIGRNYLDNIDALIYLRRFKNLESLSLSENPLEASPNYRLHVCSILPNLIYLDYFMFGDEEKRKSMEMFADFNGEQLAEDAIRDEQEIKMKHNKEKYQKDYEAFVEDLDPPNFANLLFSEDENAERFITFPAIFSLTDAFKHIVGAIAKEIYDIGHQKNDERQADEECFWKAINKVCEETRQVSSGFIDEFLVFKRKMWKEIELDERKNHDSIDQRFVAFNSQLDHLFNQLLFFEMLAVDQIEDLVKTYEVSHAEMLASFREMVHSHIASIRDETTRFLDLLTEEAMHLVQMSSLPDEVEDIPDDLLALAQDKDQMLIALQSSHDAHTTKIDQKQDEIYARLNVFLPDIMHRLHEDLELSRNRNRIVEINHFIDYQRTAGEEHRQLLHYACEEN